MQKLKYRTYTNLSISPEMCISYFKIIATVAMSIKLRNRLAIVGCPAGVTMPFITNYLLQLIEMYRVEIERNILNANDGILPNIIPIPTTPYDTAVNSILFYYCRYGYCNR